jgi:hypothetical protein
MTGIVEIPYRGYQIAIREEAGRFTPRITREGAQVEHDGRSSDVWAGASCGSYNRALETACNAIRTGRVR